MDTRLREYDIHLRDWLNLTPADLPCYYARAMMWFDFNGTYYYGEADPAPAREYHFA